MEIAVIEAGPEDAAEILDLQRAAYQSEAQLYHDWTIPPLTQTLAQLKAEFQNKIFLKAMHAGRIVGSVRAARDGATCRIGRLIVHPDYQGRGIGTRLMGKVESRFPEADRFELFTGSKSSANIRLYHQLGYRVVREEDLSPAVRLVFMEKRQAPGGSPPTEAAC